MSQNLDTRRQLFDLIDQLATDPDSPAVRTQLRDLLLADPTLRTEFIFHSNLISGLRWVMEPSRPAAPDWPARGSLNAPAVAGPPESSLAPTTRVEPAADGNLQSPPVLGPGSTLLGPSVAWLARPAIFLGLVGLLGYYALTPINRPSEPKQDAVSLAVSPPIAEAALAAKLAAAQDHRWEGSSPRPNVGDALPAGNLQLAAGIVELVLDNGVKLVVVGPAEFELHSASHVALNRGALTAQVPQQAFGFTILAPNADVVDLGTEFGVLVSERGTTEVQVFRGAVDLRAGASRAANSKAAKLGAAGQPIEPVTRQLLVAGEAARVEADDPFQIETVAYQPDHFVRELLPSSNTSANPPSRFAQSVLADTRPVAYWNFDDAHHGITKDLVRSLKATTFIAADDRAVGPQPSDGFAGMAIGNRALDVSGEGGVGHNQFVAGVGVPLDAYSAQIWFNSSVPFDAQALHFLLGRGNGSRHKVDVRDCVLVAGTYVDPNRKVGCLAFFDGDFAQGPIFGGHTLLRENQWYQVTLVRQDSSVEIYLNGVLEFSAKSRWQGGDGECFTFGHRVDMFPGIGLNGRFDEALLWDRALSAEEVLGMYNASRQ